MSSQSQESGSSVSSNTTPPKPLESRTMNSPILKVRDLLVRRPIQVPKLYVARIHQLKRELELYHEGEVIFWLMKQSGQSGILRQMNLPMNFQQPTPTLFAPSHRRPTQITPMCALPPNFSETETETIEVPDIYVKRLIQLKDELKMTSEGEVIHWLLKEAKESVMACTGTGTMPALFSSSAREVNKLKSFSPQAVLVDREFCVKKRPLSEVIKRAVNAPIIDGSSSSVPVRRRSPRLSDVPQ